MYAICQTVTFPLFAQTAVRTVCPCRRRRSFGINCFYVLEVVRSMAKKDLSPDRLPHQTKNIRNEMIITDDKKKRKKRFFTGVPDIKTIAQTKLNR